MYIPLSNIAYVCIYSVEEIVEEYRAMVTAINKLSLSKLSQSPTIDDIKRIVEGQKEVQRHLQQQIQLFQHHR